MCFVGLCCGFLFGVGFVVGGGDVFKALCMALFIHQTQTECLLQCRLQSLLSMCQESGLRAGRLHPLTSLPWVFLSPLLGSYPLGFHLLLLFRLPCFYRMTWSLCASVDFLHGGKLHTASLYTDLSILCVCVCVCPDSPGLCSTACLCKHVHSSSRKPEGLACPSFSQP